MLCQISRELFRTEADDRVLAVAPFFHAAGMVGDMHLGLQRGATLITLARFDLLEYLRAIQDYRITHTIALPPIVLALTEDPRVDEFDLSSLKVLTTGAAPVAAELEIACADRLGCRVRQSFGMTEATVATHGFPDELAGRLPGSIGYALPNTEWRIVDLATGDDVPPGEPGELYVRGRRS